ncbi:MAG: hypothetical protein WCZ90_17845 [Melioribacteraceae bacterium]
MIPLTFITYASEILGDTQNGLSGSKIAKYCSAFSLDYNVNIPYSEYPFPLNLSNKRSALKENLKAFSPQQQFQIIKYLCELDEFKTNSTVKDLKIKLISRYGSLSSDKLDEKINEALLEETKHWLDGFPEVLKLYEDALNKYENKIFQRNLLDDLRLALEKLLKQILGNNKSIENQINEIGAFLKGKNVSKELSNMFVKQLDYFTKYHNTYIKHDDSVIDAEIEIIFEFTCSFMKFLVRVNQNS